MSALAGKRKRVLSLGLEKQTPSMCKWLWCDKYGRTLTAGSSMAEEGGWGNPPFIINLLSLKRDGKYLKYQEAWSLTRSSPSGNTHLIRPKFQNITSPALKITFNLPSSEVTRTGREQGGGGDKSWPVHKKRECWQIWALECPVFVTSEDSTTLSFMVDRMAASKDIVKWRSLFVLVVFCRENNLTL